MWVTVALGEMDVARMIHHLDRNGKPSSAPGDWGARHRPAVATYSGGRGRGRLRSTYKPLDDAHQAQKDYGARFVNRNWGG